MRLAFAIAIQVDADILLFDEILAVGDQHFQQKCFNKLEEIKKQNKTIIIVSHNLEAMKNIAQRAIWLDNGLIKQDGKADQVIDLYMKESVNHD